MGEQYPPIKNNLSKIRCIFAMNLYFLLPLQRKLLSYDELKEEVFNHLYLKCIPTFIN